MSSALADDFEPHYPSCIPQERQLRQHAWVSHMPVFFICLWRVQFLPCLCPEELCQWPHCPSQQAWKTWPPTLYHSVPSAQLAPISFKNSYAFKVLALGHSQCYRGHCSSSHIHTKIRHSRSHKRSTAQYKAPD